MKLKWQQAPVKTQWGDEMVVASVAIDKDHTLDLYCERDQADKVACMSKPITPEEMKAWTDATWEKCQSEAWREPRQWVGLTDEEIAKVVSLAGFDPDWAEAHIATQIVRVLETKLKEKNGRGRLQ